MKSRALKSSEVESSVGGWEDISWGGVVGQRLLRCGEGSSSLSGDAAAAAVAFSHHGTNTTITPGASNARPWCRACCCWSPPGSC